MQDLRVVIKYSYSTGLVKRDGRTKVLMGGSKPRFKRLVYAVLKLKANIVMLKPVQLLPFVNRKKL